MSEQRVELGGPGWTIDPCTLLPVLLDEAVFRAAHHDDPLLEVVVALWSGDATRAEALLDGLAGPVTPRRRALRADAWRDSGRTGEAVVEYRRLVEECAGEPSEAVMHQHLGKALFAAGRYTAAAEAFERALRLRRDPGADASLARSSGLALERARALAARSPGLTLPEDPPSHGEVRLRGLEERDVGMLRDLAGDPYLPLIGTLPPHADHDQALAYVERQRERLARGTGYPFCVALRASDEAVGLAGLNLGATGDGRAAVGYAVAPAARGRGLARQALVALTAFAWTLPWCARLEAYVEPWNAASLATAERAGFVREGLLRSHQVIGGRRVDMVLLAALRP